jgi:hypothetical protein
MSNFLFAHNIEKHQNLKKIEKQIKAFLRHNVPLMNFTDGTILGK